MEIKERTEQKTLAIRLFTPVEKLSAVMGESYGEIAQYLASHGADPAGKAASETHIGPYEKIDEAYNRLTAFVKEKKLKTESFCYEFYLNDPREAKPEELQTEIFFPIKA